MHTYLATRSMSAGENEGGSRGGGSYTITCRKSKNLYAGAFPDPLSRRRNRRGLEIISGIGELRNTEEGKRDYY